MLLSYFKDIKYKQILITFHSLADLDAVGSAFALKSWFPNSKIVPPDDLNSHSKRLLKALNLSVDKFDSKHEALIVLDTHSKILLGRFSVEKADIVIDHHMKQESIDAKHAIIDNSYCSTSEIVYEILKELGPINATAATCLIAGMVSDSAGFKNATKKTFQYLSELIEISEISYSKILDLTFSRPDVSQRIAILKAIQRCEVHREGNYIITTSSINTCESLAAESTVSIGADVSLVGYLGDDARISARMRNELKDKVNLANVMSEAGKILGGSGGGHEVAAGANGPEKEKLQGALSASVDIIRDKLKVVK